MRYHQAAKLQRQVPAQLLLADRLPSRALWPYQGWMLLDLPMVEFLTQGRWEREIIWVRGPFASPSNCLRWAVLHCSPGH